MKFAVKLVPIVLGNYPKNVILTPLKVVFIGPRSLPYFSWLHTWHLQTERLLLEAQCQDSLQRGVISRQELAAAVKINTVIHDADCKGVDKYHQHGFITVASKLDKLAADTCVVNLTDPGTCSSSTTTASGSNSDACSSSVRDCKYDTDRYQHDQTKVNMLAATLSGIVAPDFKAVNSNHEVTLDQLSQHANCHFNSGVVDRLTWHNCTRDTHAWYYSTKDNILQTPVGNLLALRSYVDKAGLAVTVNLLKY